MEVGEMIEMGMVVCGAAVCLGHHLVCGIFILILFFGLSQIHHQRGGQER
jgi:hypothetical protein